MKSPGAPVYLTPGEVSRMLQVSPATLRNWRSRGGGPPYVKVGRLVRYRLEDVGQYAEAREMNATWERRVRR